MTRLSLSPPLILARVGLSNFRKWRNNEKTNY